MVIISLTVCHLRDYKVNQGFLRLFLNKTKSFFKVQSTGIASPSHTCKASHAHKRKKMTVRFSTRQLHSDKGLQMLSSCQKSVHNSTLFVNLIDLMTDFRGKLHVIVYPSLQILWWTLCPVIDVFPQSRSPFSASHQTFCLTVCSYLTKQKYGLFRCPRFCWHICYRSKLNSG